MDSAGTGETSRSESVFPSNDMNIKIKTSDSRIYRLTVHTQMTVSTLKQEVAGATGVLAQQQLLLHGGQVLRDERLLSSYTIEEGHTVHLVPRHSEASSSSQPDPAEVPSNTHNSHNLEAADPNIPLTGFNIHGHGNVNYIIRVLFYFIQGLLRADGNAGGQIMNQDAIATMFQSVIRMRRLYVRNDELTPVPPPEDPTLDALAILLMETWPLFNTTIDDLYLLSRGLEHYTPSVDSRTRNIIYLEAQRLGAQLLDIGAFLLELGRATSNVRSSPDTEAVVRSGPSVYITRAGPLPSLLQPRNASQPAGTSSAVPNSSTVQTPVSEVEDRNVGTSSRQAGNHSSSPPDSKRPRRE